MNTSRSIKSLLLVSALALGAGFTAHAAETLPGEEPAPFSGTEGLLGQKYGTLSYSYLNLDDSSTHGDNYNFALNTPLSFGLDGLLSYDYSQSGEIAGSRLKMHTFGVGLRAFSTAYNWGKPFIEAGAGYAKASWAGNDDNSVVWTVAVGAEFQVSPRTTITPLVRYTDAPDLVGSGTTTFGAKANYWVNSQWAVTAGLDFDDDRNTSFTVGTNFRF